MRQSKPFSEEDWKVEKAQNGDSRYYSEILDRCLSKKRNYAARMSGIDETEVEDMILEKFQPALSSFVPGGMSFYTYFENIILRRIIDETRSFRRRKVSSSVDQILEDHSRFGAELPVSFAVVDKIDIEPEPIPQIVIENKFPRYLLEAWVNHRRSQKLLTKAEAKALRIEIAVSSGDTHSHLFLFPSSLLRTCEDDLSLICELYLKARLASKQPRNLADKLGITKPLLSAIQSHFKSNARIVVSTDGKRIDDTESGCAQGDAKTDQSDSLDSDSRRFIYQHGPLTSGSKRDDEALWRAV